MLCKERDCRLATRCWSPPSWARFRSPASQAALSALSRPRRFIALALPASSRQRINLAVHPAPGLAPRVHPDASPAASSYQVVRLPDGASDALSIALLFSGVPGTQEPSPVRRKPPIIRGVNGRYGLAVASRCCAWCCPWWVASSAQEGNPLSRTSLSGWRICRRRGDRRPRGRDRGLEPGVDSCGRSPSDPDQTDPKQHAKPARTPTITFTSAAVVPTNEAPGWSWAAGSNCRCRKQFRGQRAEVRQGILAAASLGWLVPARTTPR